MSMQRASAQASKTLFRCTAKASRSHQSIAETERLRTNPVPGFTTWYKTGHCNNVTYAKHVYLQNVRSGDVKRLELHPEYPTSLPEELMKRNVSNLRDFVVKVKRTK